MDKCLAHILFWFFMLSSCWVALGNDWLVVGMHVLYTLLDFKTFFCFPNFLYFVIGKDFLIKLLFYRSIEFIETSSGIKQLCFFQSWKVIHYRKWFYKNWQCSVSIISWSMSAAQFISIFAWNGRKVALFANWYELRVTKQLTLLGRL